MCLLFLLLWPAIAQPEPASARSICTGLWGCLTSSDALPTWGGYKTRLEALGISPSFDYAADLLGNVSGGERRAFAYAGELDVGLSFDLGKLIGFRGTTFTISGVYSSGEDLSTDAIGNVLTVAQVEGLTNFFGPGTIRLYNLFLEQALLDDRLHIAAGRMGMGDYFLTADLYNNFVSGAINQNPTGTEFNLPGFSVSPVSTWGSRVRYEPAESTYIMAGVFYSDSTVGLDSKQGVDFSIRSDRGAITILQLGYDGEAISGLPGEYYVGSYYDSNRFANLGDSAQTRYGNYGIYFYAEQMIYREGGRESKQGLTPFVSAVFAPLDAFNEFPYYAMGGVVYQGLIPGRDDDVAGLGIYYGQFSDELDGTYEMIFELTYAIQLTPWLSIQPDLQYVLRPSGTGRIPDAVVLGWQVAFDL